MTTPDESNTPSDSEDPSESSNTSPPPSDTPQESSSPAPSGESPSQGGSGGIMGMLQRNMLLIGIGAVVVVVIVVVVVLFTSGVFGGGGGGPSDLQDYVLEDTYSVRVVGVSEILSAEEIPAQLDAFVYLSIPRITDDYDPEDWKDEWRDDWEDDAEDIGFTLDEVENVMVVQGQASYTVITGSFLLGDLRDSLEDEGYEDDEYRDQEIWEDGGEAIALRQSGDKNIIIGGGVDDVQEVLKAIDRGEGFLEDDSALRQVMARAGDSLAYNANTDCASNYFSTSSLRGCNASIETVTGGDLDSSTLSGALIFSSERRSESGQEDLEDYIEDQDYYDVDLDDIAISGVTVTYKITIFEE